jgi:PhnB protein
MKEINAYLIFNGNCREAMTFYQKCLGADLHLITFADMGGNIPPEAKDRIAHARITKGTAVLMASDNMPGMPFSAGGNYFVCV